MLPTSDYRIYVRAARILARVMGDKAPTVSILIEAQLVRRDPTGVADDYLDSIGWPLSGGRTISLRCPVPKSPRTNKPLEGPRQSHRMHQELPLDATRN